MIGTGSFHKEIAGCESQGNTLDGCEITERCGNGRSPEGGCNLKDSGLHPAREVSNVIDNDGMNKKGIFGNGKPGKIPR